MDAALEARLIENKARMAGMTANGDTWAELPPTVPLRPFARRDLAPMATSGQFRRALTVTGDAAAPRAA